MAAEAAEGKLTDYLRSEIGKIDRDCVRPLQVQAFQCCASCCKDRESSQDVVQRCLAGCMQPVLDAEKNMEAEVQELQRRLTRCAQQCEDEFKDSAPTGGGQPSAQDMDRAQQCLVKCCDSNSKLIPKLVSKIRSSIRTC